MLLPRNWCCLPMSTDVCGHFQIFLNEVAFIHTYLCHRERTSEREKDGIET